MNCQFCNEPVDPEEGCATAEGGIAHQECVEDSFCGDCNLPAKQLTRGLCGSCYEEALCPRCGKLRVELGWEPCEHCGGVPQ